MKIFKHKLNNVTVSIDFEAKLHPITLEFDDKSLEKSFRISHFLKSIRVLRLALLTSIALYAAFAILDKMSSPDVYHNFFVVRFYIVIPLLFIFLFITLLKGFYRIWQFTMSTALIISGLGIIYMLHLDPNNFYYYGGLFLIFMGGYFYLRLRFVFAVTSGIILIILYTVSFFIIPKTDSSSISTILVSNAFFIASNIICMIGLYSSEKLERISFYRLELLNKNKIEIENINLSLEEKVKVRTKELSLATEKALESDKLKTEFLHNMSHEVRTPMNGIMGFSNLLCKLDGCTDIQKSYTSIIQNSSNQLLHIINDILEISTLETKQLSIQNSEFDLNQFILEIFSIYDLKSKERNLPLYVKKAQTNGTSKIVSDKTKLHKILNNLLDNAFKFTNSGKIEFGYSIKDSNIIFFVSDTGIGISDDKKETIFNRFSQESVETAQEFGGLGLGLSIAKENAELLGGNISINSDKGKGTTFVVEIPYITAKLNSPEIVKSKNNKEKSRKITNLLIAEDEEVNYLYLETILQSTDDLNVNLHHAINGEEAVKKCLQDDMIDIVLMDIKMPVMNGYTATEKIKAIKPYLPIIAQTAYSTASEKELALVHGCNDFISKPIDKEKLLQLINKYMIKS